MAIQIPAFFPNLLIEQVRKKGQKMAKSAQLDQFACTPGEAGSFDFMQDQLDPVKLVKTAKNPRNAPNLTPFVRTGDLGRGQFLFIRCNGVGIIDPPCSVAPVRFRKRQGLFYHS